MFAQNPAEASRLLRFLAENEDDLALLLARFRAARKTERIAAAAADPDRVEQEAFAAAAERLELAGAQKVELDQGELVPAEPDPPQVLAPQVLPLPTDPIGLVPSVFAEAPSPAPPAAASPSSPAPAPVPTAPAAAAPAIAAPPASSADAPKEKS